MDGWMDGWMYGCMEVWMYGCMDVWMDLSYMDVYIYIDPYMIYMHIVYVRESGEGQAFI